MGFQSSHNLLLFDILNSIHITREMKST
uniref:Uncharacterized protein n=1 Tax=Arundo donax TaxID=35708 RepID=A0A0A9HH06_ARUDO